MTASQTGSLIVDPHTWVPFAIHLKIDKDLRKGKGVLLSGLASSLKKSYPPALKDFGDLLDDSDSCQNFSEDEPEREIL